MESKSLSPETMKLASEETATSRNILSFGSRQAVVLKAGSIRFRAEGRKSTQLFDNIWFFFVKSQRTRMYSSSILGEAITSNALSSIQFSKMMEGAPFQKIPEIKMFVSMTIFTANPLYGLSYIDLL